MEKIAVTGIGVVSPSGIGKRQFSKLKKEAAAMLAAAGAKP